MGELRALDVFTVDVYWYPVRDICNSFISMDASPVVPTIIVSAEMSETRLPSPPPVAEDHTRSSTASSGDSGISDEVKIPFAALPNNQNNSTGASTPALESSSASDTAFVPNTEVQQQSELDKSESNTLRRDRMCLKIVLAYWATELTLEILIL